MRNISVLSIALITMLCAGCLHPKQAGHSASVLGSGNAVPLDASSPYALKCGTMFCDARTTYCETIKTDLPSLPSNYSCRPLPESCKAVSGRPAPTCACFPPGTRGDMCSMADKNGTPGFWRTTVGGR